MRKDGSHHSQKTADAVVKTLRNCRNEESFTQMWSHANVIAQKIKIGIECTKFTFRDAKVPRIRPSRRLQGLTGETPAAANDSSQQTAKDHFRITVYTSIDKVVSELQSRFEGNDQEVLCALGEIVFSHSPSINNIQTVSNFYGVDSEMLSVENYDCGDPCQRRNAAVMVKMVSITFYPFYIKLKGLSAPFTTSRNF